MALATTTLSAAVAVTDVTIPVVSATSIAENRLVFVGDECMIVVKGYVAGSLSVPVLRGQQGSYFKAHVLGENVTHGLPSDFSNIAIPATVQMPLVRPVRCTQYTAAGAITLPLQGEDARANIVGSTARAMTLASPTKDLDFSRLTITSSGGADGTVAAHTVTVTAGFGGAGSGYTALTFDANGANGVELQAQNGKWVVLSLVDGTLTKVAVSIA
jgi:hypothetical protein